MRTVRIHHAEPLQDGATVTLSAGATHHVARVLRLAEGAMLVLFDGSGREWPAKLVDANKGVVEVGVSESVDRESALRITLVQGISRGERMDWTIQKAVELGVERIVPVFTTRTTVKLDAKRRSNRVEHWRGVVIGACEQSGRSRVPNVDTPVGLDQWLGCIAHPTLVLDPEARLALRDAFETPPFSLNLVVGPEGGLDEHEIDLAVRAGCIPVRLGPRVLRTETAGVVAIAALQTLFGDLSA